MPARDALDAERPPSALVLGVQSGDRVGDSRRVVHPGRLGDHRAGAEDAHRAGLVERVVVLRRDHAADDDQDVLATELGQLIAGVAQEILFGAGRFEPLLRR